jgi:hypothetical protein
MGHHALHRLSGHLGDRLEVLAGVVTARLGTTIRRRSVTREPVTAFM